MAVSGGDPLLLDQGANGLTGVSGDLGADATHVAGLGKHAGGAAPGQVGELADIALAAVGGALAAAATLAAALREGAHTASTQLDEATGGAR